MVGDTNIPWRWDVIPKLNLLLLWVRNIHCPDNQAPLCQLVYTSHLIWTHDFSSCIAVPFLILLQRLSWGFVLISWWSFYLARKREILVNLLYWITVITIMESIIVMIVIQFFQILQKIANDSSWFIQALRNGSVFLFLSQNLSFWLSLLLSSFSKHE